jgi:predicted amidohydrolase
MHSAIAQLNQVLGISGNGAAILAATGEAAAGARLVVTPSFRCAAIRRKISCCGRRFSTPRARARLLASGVRGTPVVVGFPERDGGARYNSLAVLADGRVTGLPQATAPELHRIRRGALFRAGERPQRARCRRHGGRALICEDVWFAGPARRRRRRARR